MIKLKILYFYQLNKFGGFHEKLKQVFKKIWTIFTSYSY